MFCIDCGSTEHRDLVSKRENNNKIKDCLVIFSIGMCGDDWCSNWSSDLQHNVFSLYHLTQVSSK